MGRRLSSSRSSMTKVLVTWDPRNNSPLHPGKLVADHSLSQKLSKLKKSKLSTNIERIEYGENRSNVL